ncbi:MAG: response regulator transcription factor [Polyangiaceae bacterium]
MIRTLIADDHALLRRGLRQLLESALPNVDVVEAATRAEASGLVEESSWHLAVLDLSLPDGLGFSLVTELRKRSPRAGIVVLSAHGEKTYATRALRAGANAYVSKDTAERDLLAAVQKALEGGLWVSAEFGEQLAHELVQPRSGAPHEQLSNREMEVLLAIARGMAVGQIAEQMSLSVKTVSTYRARILEKLALANNAELMRYAFDQKLL